MMGTQQKMDGTKKWDEPIKEEQLGASRVGVASPPWKRLTLFLTVNERLKEKSLLKGGYQGQKKRGRPERREPLRTYKKSYLETQSGLGLWSFSYVFNRSSLLNSSLECVFFKCPSITQFHPIRCPKGCTCYYLYSTLSCHFLVFCRKF